MSPQNQSQVQVTPSRRPPDVEDYIDMVRRYRSWIIGPMFAGLVVATIIAFLWPDTFVSIATMRIVPQQVSQNLIPASLNTMMAERLMSMQTEILSRGSLTEIIMKPSLDLYKKERLKLPLEDVITEMKNKAIHISSIADRGSSSRDGRTAAFQISFSYIDRYKAQQVVRELVTKFTEQNITLQRTRTSIETTFLTDELKSAKDKLDDLDQKLAKFRMENAGRLPEQAQSNVTAQSNLQMQIIGLGTQLTQAQSDKSILEANMRTLQSRLRNAQANLEQTVTINQPQAQAVAVRNENLINLDKAISEQKAALASMRRRYGSNHPDVAAAAVAVDELERQRMTAFEHQDPQTPAPQAGGPTVQTQVNPEAQRTMEQTKNDIEIGQAQITAKQLRIDEIGRQNDQLSKQLAAYQKRLEDEPLSTQQYAALQRDASLAKADYEAMMKNRDAAETRHSLEEHRAGEQLEVLDSASLPEAATDPNRPLWSAMGVFGGLAIGLVLAAAREVKDTSLKNLKDVRAYTNLPVLTSIPLLENALLVRRKRRLVWLAWSICIITGVLLMSGSVYYHWTAI
jgi:uncharacterized protein involved in exopolysaccharide biosynthesis